MRLEKGDVIKTALSENTTVLDVKDNQAILFSGTQFVLATGVKENKESGKFEWDNGRYADDLKSISDIQNNNFETMKDTLSFLAEYNHSDFVKGMISLETGIENETALDTAYDNYMNDKIMGLIDETFYHYIDENEIKTPALENGKEDKNSALSAKENTKENENAMTNDKSDENMEKENTINIDGNIASDIEIKNLTSKDGKDFTVASFAIAENDKEGKVKYTNCLAYNDKVSSVENLKKGDFVHIFGKEKISQGKDGKEYMSLKVYSAKLLKAKEQVKTNQKTKETKKSSALGKLKEYKEKAGEKSREQSGIKKEKNVER
nr:single-stranded DNA-binding protein [Filifactor alocis]